MIEDDRDLFHQTVVLTFSVLLDAPMLQTVIANFPEADFLGVDESAWSTKRACPRDQIRKHIISCNETAHRFTTYQGCHVSSTHPSHF